MAALPPTVDLAWMLMICEPIAVSKQLVIDRYHEQLSRRVGHPFDERTWDRCFASGSWGQAVRQMGQLLWGAYQTEDPLLRDMWLRELPWWCDQTRADLKWL